MWSPREPGGCEATLVFFQSHSLCQKPISTHYNDTEAANKGVALRDENYAENASTPGLEGPSPRHRSLPENYKSAASNTYRLSVSQ